MMKNYDDMLSRFHTIPACHGQTDGRTDGWTDGRTELLYQYRASAAVCWRAIKIVPQYDLWYVWWDVKPYSTTILKTMEKRRAPACTSQSRETVISNKFGLTLTHFCVLNVTRYKGIQQHVPIVKCCYRNEVSQLARSCARRHAVYMPILTGLRSSSTVQVHVCFGHPRGLFQSAESPGVMHYMSFSVWRSQCFHLLHVTFVDRTSQ